MCCASTTRLFTGTPPTCCACHRSCSTASSSLSIARIWASGCCFRRSSSAIISRPQHRALLRNEGAEILGFFQAPVRDHEYRRNVGQKRVPHINGGLFADDPLINALSIPNHIFAATGQGANEASLDKDKNTLLFLSARYNYAAKGDAKKPESLHAGPHFRAVDHRAGISRRRAGRPGHGRQTFQTQARRRYYTPEWVVNYLVEETLGPWFAAARQECGYRRGAKQGGLESLSGKTARHPHHRSGLRLRRVPDFGLPPALGGTHSGTRLASDIAGDTNASWTKRR